MNSSVTTRGRVLTNNLCHRALTLGIIQLKLSTLRMRLTCLSPLLKYSMTRTARMARRRAACMRLRHPAISVPTCLPGGRGRGGGVKMVGPGMHAGRAQAAPQVTAQVVASSDHNMHLKLLWWCWCRLLAV